MAKAAYVGIDEVARKIKKIYIGAEEIAHKVKKGYIGVDGWAKQFFSSGAATYTGTYSVSQVEISGVTYDLYTFTESGTLTLEADAQYWICGSGGGGGDSTITTRNRAGGGGGGGYVQEGNIPKGKYTITIAAGATANSSGSASQIVKENGLTLSTAKGATVMLNEQDGGKGGSGGGAGTYVNYSSTSNSGYVNVKGTVGEGDGGSKYPFGLTSLYAHCAGGGGGQSRYEKSGLYSTLTGGKGGSNGSDGSVGTSWDSTASRASGGAKGGGAGGSYSSRNGVNASFYGSGGGGAGFLLTSSAARGTGGKGYQGVCYILIPA